MFSDGCVKPIFTVTRGQTSHETNYCKLQFDSIQTDEARLDPDSNLDRPNVELIININGETEN